MRPTSAHSGLRGPPLTLCDIMQRGYLPQVPLLVNLGANLEVRDRTGRTPLMLTAYVQPEDWGVGVARLLIEEGVRMTRRDKYGMNALHHACVYERVELVRVLLHAPDFDLVQGDKFGNTALHYAAMTGNAVLVGLLAAHHRRYRLPMNKPNNQGRTARDEAFLCGSHVCTDILDNNFPISGSPTGKEDALSESDSTVPVFILKEEATSVATSEGVRPLCHHGESKVSVNDDARTAGSEDVRLSARREDDEGGLFIACDQGSQEEIVKKHLLTPHHSPPASEKSVDTKVRSPDISTKTRRSGVRRVHPMIQRRSSAGSSCSSRSAVSARNQSLLSVRSISYSNNLNANSENSNTEAPANGVENEMVQVTDIGKPPKGVGLQQLRRNSVLSENTNLILNNAEGRTTPSFITQGRPTSKAATTYSTRREATYVGCRSQSQPLPYEKDPDRVIHVASEHDFRNTREYVLKLTKMSLSPAVSGPESLPTLVPPPPPLSRQDEEDVTKKPDTTDTWRSSIRFLFRHLEYQCSPSFREAAKPPPDAVFIAPHPPSAQGEEADDAKEKKVRRPSSSTRPQSQMNDVSTSGNTKRKPTSSKQRKISAINPPSAAARGGHGERDPGGDNVTVSSSESVSAGSSKKKSDTRTDQGTASNSGGSTASRNKSQTPPTGDN